MVAWAPNVTTRGALGRFQILFHAPGGVKQDVTFFRNVPTTLSSYSSADPFGDSVAVISFPQVTIFDEIGTGEMAWLHDFADVDIMLIPADGGPVRKVWEGFVASMEWSSNDESSSLTVQCQGALFQADKYVQGPFFPPRPVTYERLMYRALDPAGRPHLRTKALKVAFPPGWSKKQPTGTPSLYTPIGATPGALITGYSTRSTGSWDRALTSFIGNLLQVMYTDDGDQWTMRMDTGRQPILYVRQRNQVPKYTVWAAQPGVGMSVTRDMTQFANLVYGQGTDIDGVVYNRQIVSAFGGVTSYDPMAYDSRVYPTTDDNPRYTPNVMRAETMIKFDNGFDERQAVRSAQMTLRNNADPGFSGSMTLGIDPQGGSRYLMRAGDKILVKYLVGHNTTGVTFHIAEVNVNPDDGTVNLKIDTKFRDLLTLEEALNRTRDPLTPVKMLQLNKRSQVVDDVLAPWDYTKGSGFFPKTSVKFYQNLPASEKFPYVKQAKIYSPKKNPQMYIKVTANAKTANGRWYPAVQIRLSEKGDIRHTQFAVYDFLGNRVACPFHVSLYYNPVEVDGMPTGNNGQHSPFVEGAFENLNKYGFTPPADIATSGGGGTNASLLNPDSSLIIGWGNHDQPAGYSPGSHASGDPVTGVLVDDSSWNYTLSNINGFDVNPDKPGRATEDQVSIYANFYAEYKEPVYIMGRCFRKEPGT